MGDRVASRLVYSLLTVSETEGTNAIVNGDVLEELRSSRETDARLAMEPEGKEKLGTEVKNQSENTAAD